MIWLAVSISLSFEEPLEVFEKFAALFIFSHTEWVIGIIVQLIWQPEVDDGDEIENYLEFRVDLKSFALNKFKWGWGILAYTVLLLVLYVCEATM